MSAMKRSVRSARRWIAARSSESIPSTRRQYDTDAAKTTEHVLGNITAVPPKDLTKDSLLTAEDLRGLYRGIKLAAAGWSDWRSRS